MMNRRDCLKGLAGLPIAGNLLSAIAHLNSVPSPTAEELEIFDIFRVNRDGEQLIELQILLSRDAYPQRKSFDLDHYIPPKRYYWSVAASFGCGADVHLLTEEEILRGEYLGNLCEILGGCKSSSIQKERVSLKCHKCGRDVMQLGRYVYCKVLICTGRGLCVICWECYNGGNGNESE